jgi:dolichyl-phosphate-mannose-protein mannosyltransferase
MSDFRARRAPSPLPRSYPPQQPTVNQRFPGRPQDHLDADQKRATAVAGPLRKQHPSGGLRITSAEWKLIGAVIIFAVFIRLYVIWKPNSVV